MALVRNYLSYMGGAGRAPRLWSYNSPDLIATVVAANYFQNAYQQLQVGDFIFIRANSGAAGAAADMVIVCILTCTSAGVTVATKSA
jgi:hypothetical protein